MGKVQVTQDALYEFLLAHDVKMVRLAQLSGLSEATLNICFKHVPYPNGALHSFTAKGVEAINQALPQMAAGLRGCILTFGSDQAFTNQRGKRYDPALIGPMKAIGSWVNLTALVQKQLGWSKAMKDNVLVSRSGKAYGCISIDDVNRINAELLAVAGVLDGYELILSESSSFTD